MSIGILALLILAVFVSLFLPRMIRAIGDSFEEFRRKPDDQNQDPQ